METAFISRLQPLVAAMAQTRDVYVPVRTGDHYSCRTYDPQRAAEPELNEIRMSAPVKELLFPLRELAAVLSASSPPPPVRPFAVFGLKACDLRSAEILDRVFLEKDFEDPFYQARREQMFVVSSDCSAPGASCFCNLLGGKPYPEGGFDLNVSRVPDGFVLQCGSARGTSFLVAHRTLFGEVPDVLLEERARTRAAVERQLAQTTRSFRLDASPARIVEERYGSDVFDEQARTCVECQACTRVCPTCHCFYLYDTRQQEYLGSPAHKSALGGPFAKMKMWDSCLRIGHAEVAGGANPRRLLGDRLRHRFLHKFVYFRERYGMDMCVGCGRCVDAEAGAIDIRTVLQSLNDELLAQGSPTAKGGSPNAFSRVCGPQDAS
jgi:sulfhydrogenase subunit beta (sulfur reductase)